MHPGKGARGRSRADRRSPERRPRSVRRTRAPHLRRHVHTRATPHGERGGRARRGAGRLPAGLASASGSSAARPSSRRGCTGSRPTPRPRTHASASGTRPSPSRSWPNRSTPTRRLSPRRRPSLRTRCNASRAALDELPPKLRSLVVLKDVYGLPHDAIAEELGISVPAAKVRLHRARKKLRDRLYEEGVEAHAV